MKKKNYVRAFCAPRRVMRVYRELTNIFIVTIHSLCQIETKNTFADSRIRARAENRANNQKGPGLSDLHDLANMFLLMSQDNPNPNVLSREQFVASITKTIVDDSFDSRMAQKLYTTFDRKASNRIAWVLIIASIRALVFDGEPATDKIIGIFEVFEKYMPQNKITSKNCNVIFSIVSGSEEEKHAMNTAFRHSFSNYLRDATRKRNRNSTLDFDTDTVQFAKVSKVMFAEAVRKSARDVKGIVKLFEAQCERTRRKSGAVPRDNLWENPESKRAEEVKATLL